MRLFLDANVLFSAAYSATGNARALFDIADLCGATLASSPFAVEEASRNLRLKFPAAQDAFGPLIENLELVASPDRESLERAARHGLPEKDIPILAAAIAVRARILVTGDRRHFGRLFVARVVGLEILPPLETLHRLLREAEQIK